MSLPTSPRVALAAALIGAGLLAASAAHAFTIENENAGGGQDQSFLYPDRGAAGGSGQNQQGFTSKDGLTTYKEGNATLQFGHWRSSPQNYNADQLFEPLGHPPGVR